MTRSFKYIQIALFSEGIVLADKLMIANQINEISNKIFDGDPVILPLPMHAPPEIPRIQMTSKEGEYSLLISQSRVDIIQKFMKEKSISDNDVPEDIFKIFLLIFSFLHEELHGQFYRAAIITEWALEVGVTKPVQAVLSSYMRQDSPINHPNKIEIHSLYQEQLDSFAINKWLKIKSFNEQESEIIISIDINTTIENQILFDKKLLESFLRKAYQRATETFLCQSKSLGGK